VTSVAGSPLRLFIAIPAPPAVRQAADRVIAGLRGAGDVRWVTPERLHLTLKFLGATPPEKVEGISAALAEKANVFSSFMVYLGGAGAFPNRRRPQTVWMGVEGEGTAALARLAEEIDEAVHPFGFDREKRAFRAHLTIGRVKSQHGLRELSARLGALESGSAEPVPWPVEEFHLVQSILRPDGPEYTPLRRYSLRRPA
jgi:2'-5' RNA ligase